MCRLINASTWQNSPKPVVRRQTRLRSWYLWDTCERLDWNVLSCSASTGKCLRSIAKPRRSRTSARVQSTSSTDERKAIAFCLYGIHHVSVMSVTVGFFSRMKARVEFALRLDLPWCSSSRDSNVLWAYISFKEITSRSLKLNWTLGSLLELFVSASLESLSRNSCISSAASYV